MLRKIIIVIFLIHHGEFTTIRKRNTNFQYGFQHSVTYIDSRSSQQSQERIVLQPLTQYQSNQNYQPLVYQSQSTQFKTNFDHTSQEQSTSYPQKFNDPSVQVEITREKVNQLNQDRQVASFSPNQPTQDQPKYDDTLYKQKADEFTQSYQETERERGVDKYLGIPQGVNSQNNPVPNVHDFHVPDKDKITIPNMPENVEIIFPPPLTYDENISSTTRASLLDAIKRKNPNKSTTENFESVI